MRRVATPALKLTAAAAAVLAVGAGLLGVLIPGPSGPTGSSYATSAEGLSAYARLLTLAAHPVARLEVAPSDARLDPTSTLVVLDPATLVAADVAALRRFVRSGGTLIAGGSSASRWVSELLADPPTWSSSGLTSDTPLLPVAQTRGVTQVQTAGDGTWSDPGSTLTILGPPGDSLAALASEGSGTIVLLADSSPLQNRLLAHADNAELGLALAGAPGRRVVFEEWVHGYGAANGLAALPARWKWALAGLLLAALVGVAARFRRLAPPAPPGAPAFPRRREHVDAVAIALARTGRPGEAAASVAERARHELRRRASLGPAAGEQELVRAAERFGLDADELRAMSAAQPADGDLLAAGRALAKLSAARS